MKKARPVVRNNAKNVVDNLYRAIKLGQFISTLLLPILLFQNAYACEEDAAIDDGRLLAFARDKGNCLACHAISGGTRMGDIGPPLRDIQSRFPTRQLLREQIWDAGKLNPKSLMPPFGRNKILTECEIEAVVSFVHQL